MLKGKITINIFDFISLFSNPYDFICFFFFYNLTLSIANFEFFPLSVDQNLAMTLGGGFFGGILIGYALKKVIKILSIVVGLFLAGLAYLQSQEIAKINWDKLQSVSQGAISNLANATTQQISNNIGGGNDHIAAIAMANFGIPLTGSMATGFAFGFMKG